MRALRILTLALLALAAPADRAEAPDRDAETWFLARVRQLTYEGRRAGEGYFSPDGLRMVFQSERDPANPFFQIYELDLETGETRRVSNGVGKTTCPFIRPGSGHVLYASTHHDPASARLQREEECKGMRPHPSPSQPLPPRKARRRHCRRPPGGSPGSPARTLRDPRLREGGV